MRFLDLIRNANTGAAVESVPFRVCGQIVGVVRKVDILPILLSRPDVFQSAADGTLELAGADISTCSAALDRLLLQWKQDASSQPPIVQTLARRWRDERYPIYNSNGKSFMTIERAAACFFGIRAFGTHLNGYTRDAQGRIEKMWIARRSSSKKTYPSMLDNTVGGGLPAGFTPRDNMIKEANEEASIGVDLMKHAQAAGYISFTRNAPERGITAETDYVFDLDMGDFIPKPQDGEVEQFYLWTVDEVKQRLFCNEFTPEAGLVIIDFFCRHDIINAENTPEYATIVKELRNELRGLPGPKWLSE